MLMVNIWIKTLYASPGTTVLQGLMMMRMMTAIKYLNFITLQLSLYITYQSPQSTCSACSNTKPATVKNVHRNLNKETKILTGKIINMWFQKISVLPSPTKGIGNIGNRGGRGEFQRQKHLNQCMKLNWNFWRGGVIGQIPSMAGMDIFWNHTLRKFVE